MNTLLSAIFRSIFVIPSVFYLSFAQRATVVLEISRSFSIVLAQPDKRMPRFEFSLLCSWYKQESIVEKVLCEMK